MFVTIIDNQFKLIDGDLFTGEGDDAVRHPRMNLHTYSDTLLQSYGVFRVMDAPPVPAGFYVTGSRFERDGDVVRVVYDLAQVEDPVPPEVSAAQAKLALRDAGFLAPVMAQIDGLGPLSDQFIWFHNATMWERSNAHVISFGSALGLSPRQVDDLFRQASTLV